MRKERPRQQAARTKRNNKVLFILPLVFPVILSLIAPVAQKPAGAQLQKERDQQEWVVLMWDVQCMCVQCVCACGGSALLCDVM